MTTPAAIRQATPRDAFAVAALHLQLARERSVAPDAGFLDRWADAWLAEHRDRPFWLAEIENRPLGVAGLHVVSDLPGPGQVRGDRWGIASILYVTPTFRRCGLGGQLSREVSTWAAAHGLTRIVADLEPLGPAGSGIARRLGPTGGQLVETRLRQPVTLF